MQGISYSFNTAYRGMRVGLFAAITIVVAIIRLSHLPAWQLGSSSPRRGSANHSLGLAPLWEMDPLITPYMGNLTCIFEVAQWNLESHLNPIDVEKRRKCGNLRFRPYDGWIAPDPNIVFKRLPHDSTIYLLGDSVTLQHGVDLLCYLASVSNVTRADIARLGEGSWCNVLNQCEVDYKGYNPFSSIRASFCPWGKSESDEAEVHIIVQRCNRFSTERNCLDILAKGREGDIFVINEGLHSGGFGEMLKQFNKTIPALLSLVSRGGRVVWRETSASHFNTPDGYQSSELVNLQKNRTAHCVPPSAINATSSRNRFNAAIVPIIKSFGIPVLEVWEASFLMPEWCHIGGGRDCLHMLQPGATSYFTESLLKYIEENI